MRTIDRYIIREIAVPFCLGLAVFTLILLVARILRLIELVVNRGVPLVEVAKLFSYILPSFLEVTVPMALLLAILVGLGRLSADSEIVALRSCGVSLGQIARPIAAVAVVGFLLATALSLYARPWGNHLLRDGLFEIAKVRASAGIRPRVFNDDFAGLVLYVDQVEPPGNVLQGILISGSVGPGTERPTAAGSGERTTVAAKAGVLIPNEERRQLTLRLYEGSLHAVNRDGSRYHRTDFGTYDLTLDLDTALADLQQRERTPREIRTHELRSRIAADTDAGGADLEDRIELARRYSVPFACLGFAAVAVPLGIRPSPAARSRSFALSIVLILAYYLLLTLGESLAGRGSLPPLAALAIPNLGLFALAILLFLRASRAVHKGERFSDWKDRIARGRAWVSRRMFPRRTGA